MSGVFHFASWNMFSCFSLHLNVHNSVNRLTAILLLSVPSVSPSPLSLSLSRCMKGRLVCHNRGLTILHSFSNPHPSLPYLFSPLSSPSFPSDWTPFFLRGCLWSLLFIHLFQPPSIPSPKAKRENNNLTLHHRCTVVYTQFEAPCFACISLNFNGWWILFMSTHILNTLKQKFNSLRNTLIHFLAES